MELRTPTRSADRLGDGVHVSTSSPWSALRRVLAIYLAGLFLVSIGMRLWRLGEYPGLNGDEAWYGVLALRWCRGEEHAFRTPTGNLINWLFVGPQVLVHACGAASTAGLRTVSLAAGLAALPAGYWACRRQFDAATARAFVFLLAILPVNIAYCRFAWDASESLLATVLALFAACAASRPVESRSGLWWGAVALFVACYVHPTNLFLLPVLAGIVWRVVYEDFQRLTARAQRIVSVAAGVTACGAIVSLFLVPRLARVVEHLTSPDQYVEFLVRFTLFATGTSLYQYISRPASDAFAFASCLSGGVAAVVVIVGVYRRVRATREPQVLGLGVGLIVALGGFYAVAGSDGAATGYERYLIWCIAPGALAASLGWRSWAAGSARHEAMGLVGAAVAGTLLLAGMQTQYFLPMTRDGGDAHLTFRMGDQGDPKAAALALVDRQAEAGTATPIVSRSWWTRVPIEYWSLAHGEARRVRSPQSLAELTDDEFATSWFIELFASDEAAETEQEFANRGVEFERTELTDRSGRPVVIVWRPRGAERRSEDASP